MSVDVALAVPRMIARPRIATAVAAAGGAFSALAPPPLDVAPAMLAGLVVLAVVVHGAADARQAALRAFVWAFAMHLLVVHFVVAVIDRFTGAGLVGGLVALVIVAAGQSLGWAAGGALTHALWRRWAVPFPVAFAGGVFVAGLAPGLFPWTPASFVIAHPALVQLADVIGGRGVSALLAAAVGGVALGITRGTWRPLLAGLALLAALEGYGLARLASLPDDGPRLRVALLAQDAPPRSGDADPTGRFMRRLRTMSADAERAGAQLVVWPEASFTVPIAASVDALRGGSLVPVEPGARVPRLIGMQTAEGTRRFNSARLVLPDGTLAGRYDKVHLMPFGETVPIPGFRAVRANDRGMAPGRGVRPIVLPGDPPVRLGALICYEDIDAGLGRRVARTRPQLLVNLTNDAWFGRTTAPDLQEGLAVMRAVEVRTDLVRAVNRGPSTWVDAGGRVRARRDDGAGVLMADPELRAAGAGPTFYARAGDRPLLALLLLVGLTGWARARRPRASRRPTAHRARRRPVRPGR